MGISAFYCAFLQAIAAIAISSGTIVGSAVAGELSPTASEKVVGPDRMISLLSKESGRVPVIVEFAMPNVSSADRLGSEDAADAAHTSTVRQIQHEILNHVFLKEGGVSKVLASDELNIKLMDFSPLFGITVDQQTLEHLASEHAVVRIHEDTADEPELISSLPLIGMPTAYAGGATGSGWYVAVLDTGARRTHEFLTSKVYSAACYGTNNSNSASLCPGGVTSSTAIDSANDCDETIIAGCGHGTHVSGIAAGFNTSPSAGEPLSGVGRNARLITINVFSRFNISSCGNEYESNGCVLSYTTDQIKGLERVYSVRNIYKIASVNMSIGGKTSATYCDGDPRKHIIDQLRAVGIATVIAAGNDQNSVAVSAPACISSAITVASSTKSDSLTRTSNWGILIDLVAPGSTIASSATSEVSNSSYRYMTGTSMAAPHVAGAIAALKSARPAATVSQLETALKVTGVDITSAGVTRSRIKVDSALVALGGGGTKAVMTSPKPGTALGSSTTFQWSKGMNVSEYYLSVGSNGVGSANIYAATQGIGTSQQVSGLPSSGTIYVRLWSYFGSWQYNDYTYKAGNRAVMTSPSPGATLGSSATFVWTTGTGVSQFWLYVGSTGVGSYNIYQASQGTNRWKAVNGLPSTGTIYVRLWSLIAGSWQYNDYTYKAGSAAKAVVTAPAPGSTLGYSATFQWTTGTNVTSYWLYVGSTGIGSYNIYTANQGAVKTRTVSNLPANGTIYVRLWSLIDGAWQFNDYTYKAAGGTKAVMTSPAPGSTLGSSTTFRWSAGAGVTQYWLSVGSTGVGSWNIMSASNGQSTTRAVSKLPASGTVYVRLYSLIAGAWQYNDYTYKAGGAAKAVMITPTPNSAVGTGAYFSWSTGTGVTQYWLSVGATGAGSWNIYQGSQGTSTSRSVSKFPSYGTIYVRLWSLIFGAWQYNDYVYKAGGGSMQSVLLSPMPGSKLSISTDFEWTPVHGASEYWIYFGSAIGASDYYSGSQGTKTSNTFNFSNASGRNVFMRLLTLYDGRWGDVDYHFTAPDAGADTGDSSGKYAVADGVTRRSTRK